MTKEQLGNALATLQDAKDVVPFDPAELAKDAELGGKLGFQDMAAPFLYILQGNSPQVNPTQAKYLKGAKPSDFYLSVIEKAYDSREGLDVISCFYERSVVEWRPRGQGGIAATYPPEHDAVKSAKRVINKEGKEILQMPNGNTLVDTCYNMLYVKRPDNGVWVQCICPMKSTSIKVCRKWNNLIDTTMIPNTNFKAPRFLYMYHFSTVVETSGSYSWSQYKIEQGAMLDKEMYFKAKEFALIAPEILARQRVSEAPEQAVADEEVPF